MAITSSVVSGYVAKRCGFRLAWGSWDCRAWRRRICVAFRDAPTSQNLGYFGTLPQHPRTICHITIRHRMRWRL